MAALAGCGDSDVFLSQPWPSAHVAVVVTADADGDPVGPLRVIGPGEAATKWSIASTGDTRLYARSWAPEVRAPDGRGLVECGLTLGGTGPVVAPPSGSWVTSVLSASADPVFAVEAAPIRRFDLRLRQCQVELICFGYEARSVAVPDGFRPKAVVHVGPHALVASTPTEPDGPTRILRLRRTQAALLPSDLRLGSGKIRALTHDRSAEPHRVMLVYDTGRIVTLDDDGQYTGEFKVQPAFHFDTGVDGESMFASDVGFYRLGPGMTEAETIADTLPSFRSPEQIDEVRVFDRDVRLFRVDTELWEWTTGGWSLDYEGEPFDIFSQVGTDADFRGLVGEFEVVRIEDPATGQWTGLDRPFDQGHRFRGIDGLRQGRFAIVGERASAAVWNGEGWCQLPHDGPTSTLTRIATSTAGDEGYAVGSDSDSQVSIIVYIDVPAP